MRAQQSNICPADYSKMIERHIELHSERELFPRYHVAGGTNPQEADPGASPRPLSFSSDAANRLSKSATCCLKFVVSIARNCRLTRGARLAAIRVNLARVNLRDQPSQCVPHARRIVQARQRIQVFAGSIAFAPAPYLALSSEAFLGLAWKSRGRHWQRPRSAYHSWRGPCNENQVSWGSCACPRLASARRAS